MEITSKSYLSLLPYTHLDVFSEKASELRKEFDTTIDDIVSNYDSLVASMEESHKLLIEAIYKRKEGIDDHLDVSTNNKYHAFRDRFLSNIRAYLRPKEYVQSYSKLNYDYFVIDNKISTQISEAKSRLLNEVEKITRDAFKEVQRQAMKAQNLSLEEITKNLNKVDSLSEEDLSKKIDSLDEESKEKMETIRARKEKLNRMKQMVLETEERESASVSDLSVSLISSLRFELFESIIETLDNSKDKEVYHGKTLNKLISKLDKIESSIFFKDVELEDMITTLRAVLFIKEDKDKVDDLLRLAAVLLRKELFELEYDITSLKIDLNKLQVKKADETEGAEIKRRFEEYKKHLPKKPDITLLDLADGTTNKVGPKLELLDDPDESSETDSDKIKPNLDILG